MDDHLFFSFLLRAGAREKIMKTPGKMKMMMNTRKREQEPDDVSSSSSASRQSYTFTWLLYYYYNYSATVKRIARMIMIYILNIAPGVTHTKKAI